MIFASDTHLSETIWKKFPNIVGDSFYSFDQIISLAKEDGFLILAGDILDLPNPSSKVIHKLLEGLNQLVSAGCFVLFVQGQHDMSDPPWLSVAASILGNNAKDLFIHLDGRLFEHDGIVFGGLDYRPDFRLPDSLVCSSDDGVLVLHQPWVEFLPCGAYASLKDISGNWRHILTGDFHVTKVLDLTSSDGISRRVYSPGSSHLRSISEPPKKYVFRFSDGFLFELVRLKTRPMVLIEVRDESQYRGDFIEQQVSAGLSEFFDEYSRSDLPEYLQTGVLVVKLYSDGPFNQLCDSVYEIARAYDMVPMILNRVSFSSDSSVSDYGISRDRDILLKFVDEEVRALCDDDLVAGCASNIARTVIKAGFDKDRVRDYLLDYSERYVLGDGHEEG